MLLRAVWNLLAARSARPIFAAVGIAAVLLVAGGLAGKLLRDVLRDAT